MLKQIKLLGKLGQVFGRSFSLDINTSAEAIRALCVLCPGFREYLVYSESQGIGWRVVTSDPQGLSQEELHSPCTQVTIAPIVSGAGGGFGKILLGTALLVGSFFMPGSTVALGLTITSQSVGLLGASLILGGISQLIAPTDRTPKDKKGSSLFDAAAEPSKQGDPVPVGYGTKYITDLPILTGYVVDIDLLD